ncbi:hypothetical protein CI109_106607 [Kwoniella shandongensis]|uniref:Uncharacterized protein n=1 Tax=Kwoniella shandongensis TaxID=1734106 RepID=A0A5M6BNM5_9TREE|nr:uncharacterized protein CI109_007149 [Kwoniella shandongensis]KAA5524494.1 hypothetical protein CI109_007149 [Kwoniella shandongensis]
MPLFGTRKQTAKVDSSDPKRHWYALRDADEEAILGDHVPIGGIVHQTQRTKSLTTTRGEGTESSMLKSAVSSASPGLLADVPSVSKPILIGWRIGIALMFLSAGSLLYLLTCSVPSWRVNWSVVRIFLPKQDFGLLYDTAKSTEPPNSTTIASRMHSEHAFGSADDRGNAGDHDALAKRVASQAEAYGYVSVNMWGWCLSGDGAEQIICSPESMWFNLDDLVGKSPKLPATSFNPFLLHALIMHGIAMLAAMLAVIPMGLTTWRICRAKAPEIQGGWFEHGSVLVACLLCLTSWIVDRCLKKSVSHRVTAYRVESGSAVVITGVSTILLFAAFLLSAIPVVYMHMRRQSQLLKYWKNLEDYDTAFARQKDDDDDGGGDEQEGQMRISSSRRRLRDHRLTRIFFGTAEKHEDGVVNDRRRGRRVKRDRRRRGNSSRERKSRDRKRKGDRRRR